VSYDILAFIPLFLSVIFVERGRVKNPKLLYVIVPLYPILMLFSTWVSNTFYGFSVEPLLLFGVTRFCFVLYIIIEVLDEKHIYNAIISIVFVNFIVCIYQLSFPQESIKLFYDLYGKETHAVLKRYYEAGSFGRPTGTLLSPVNVGVLVIISYSMCLHRIKKTENKFYNYIALLFIVATGLISLTKTAWIGIPFLTLLLLPLSFVNIVPISISDASFRVTNLKYLPFLAISILGVLYFSYSIMISSEYEYQFLYYISFLYNPLEAFESRYSEGGQLAKTIDITLQYPIFGLGATRAQGEFLGDSTLIRVAHATGIFGIVLHISIYFYIIIQIIFQKDIYKILVISSLFLSGLALFTFYTKYGAVVLSYCLVLGANMKDGACSR